MLSTFYTYWSKAFQQIKQKQPLQAFDTADHNILLEKLSMYGVKGNNLKWFHSYLSNRKQYIEFQNDDKTNSLTIKYGVRQGSIMGQLLFIVNVNDFYRASNILKPNMFCR